MKVGIPVMKLNAGNIQAVIREAWLRDGETRRNCGDPDYHPERTAENVYLLGEERATDVIRLVESRKQNYEAVKGRHLRKDAILAVAGILKPNGEQFGQLSRERQMAFFRDSVEILQSREFFNDQLISCVVQFDEGIPHAHFAGIPIASDGTWSAKKVLNLRMLKKLNETYPQRMRERGWNVESLVRFDEDTYRKMSAEEKAAYVEKKRQTKAHGKSSAEFKAQAEAEKIVEKANTRAVEVLGDAMTRAKAFERAQKASAVEKAEEITSAAQKAAEDTIAALKGEIAALEKEKEEALDELEEIREDVALEGADTMRGKALTVLLDWIPEEAATRIQKGIARLIQKRREMGGIWPTRGSETPRHWPGQDRKQERNPLPR